MTPIKKAGRRVFFHSCGFLGEIFDELLDLGVEGLWPQITQAEKDPGFVAKCRSHRVTTYIHPDRQQLIPFGSPCDIEKSIQGYAECYQRHGGGGIFYVEIENDAPFENVEALIKSIHKFR
jgi:uroporphyrinogen decarboxylase